MDIEFKAAFGEWEVKTTISPIKGVAAIRYDIFLNNFFYGSITLNEKDNTWTCYIRNENDLFSSDDRQILIEITKIFHETEGYKIFEFW